MPATRLDRATPSSLVLTGLKAVYDTLTETLDTALPEQATRLLAKLVLLLAQDRGGPQRFVELATVALRGP